MNCLTFRDSYSDYSDGLLDEVTEVAAQRHLAECLRCRQFDHALRQGLGALRGGAPLAPSDDFGSRLELRLLEERSPFAPALRQWSSVMAALLLVTAGGLVVWDMAERGGQPDTAVVLPGPVPLLQAADESPLLLPAGTVRALPTPSPFQPIPPRGDTFPASGLHAEAWQVHAAWEHP